MVTHHFVQRLNERHQVVSPPTIDLLTKEIEDRINSIDDSVILIDDNEFPKNHFVVEVFGNKYHVVYNIIDKVLITCIPIHPERKKKYKKGKNRKHEKTRSSKSYRQYKITKMNGE